jgi:hypothetical protein
MDRHPSLSRSFVNCGRKSFIRFGPDVSRTFYWTEVVLAEGWGNIQKTWGNRGRGKGSSNVIPGEIL